MEDIFKERSLLFLLCMNISVTLTGKTVCSEYLVSGINGVDDAKLTSSSHMGQEEHHATSDARLYSESSISSAWVYGIFDGNQYIQLFSGNTDRNTVVKTTFNASITASYLRITPKTWSGFPALRFDVSGCYDVTENGIFGFLGFRELQNEHGIYKVNELNLDQVGAIDICGQYYTKLFRVTSPQQMSSLQNITAGNIILLHAHNELLVSGNYAAPDWKFSNEPEVINSSLWSPANPDPSKGHCVALTQAGLASVDCTKTYFSICGSERISDSTA